MRSAMRRTAALTRSASGATKPGSSLGRTNSVSRLLTNSRLESAPSRIMTSRLRNLARRLIVPVNHYAAARRLLRDKIAKHDIHFGGTGLDLNGHDEREDV